MKSLKKNFFDNCKNKWKGIKITNKAAKQIVFIMSKNPEIKGIKLKIKKTGCAGLGYEMELVNTNNYKDLKFSYLGANLYIETSSMIYIDGTEIDYINDGLNQSFKFNNPKSQHNCGCGESFSIE